MSWMDIWKKEKVLEQLDGFKLVRQGVNNLGTFENQVDDLIGEGWEIHGEIMLLDTQNGRVLVQPMVRYLGDGDHL